MNLEGWEQNGFILFPRAVTNFYILRYLQWIDSLSENQKMEVHHQFLWDIRMYEPVYKAFCEILGTEALWANLDQKEPSHVKGRVCLQQSVHLPAGKNEGNKHVVNMGDLLIFNSEIYSYDFDSDCNWLPLTLFPAVEENPSLLMKRIQSWNAKTCRTYLTSTGRKLLGIDRW
ncbi:hypothetical protein [Cohnella thermotolerans]|uniref:hypothetical protein n=1 Tax=Cohnella thermotolerans TaxID=329858 RepID=UPI0004796F63|nr:hypothetical protein [Cohnella thermotolerans]